MEQPQGIPVDPVAAFETFQQFHGMEMARMAGEFVRVNTFCAQLQKENAALQERITALEQNAAEGNGKMTQSGADLQDVELHPSAPATLRKVRDNPQA
jgi:hypothetical protein